MFVVLGKQKAIKWYNWHQKYIQISPASNENINNNNNNSKLD